MRLTLTYYPTKQSAGFYLYLNGQKSWNGSLAELNEGGIRNVWVRAALNRERGGRNGVQAWALYASSVGPKLLQPPETLTHPEATADTL